MSEQRSITRRAWVIASKPFVISAWRVREHRRFRRNFPIEWKTPGEIIALDLENHEDEKDFELNKAMAEDLLPARDAARARSDKLTITGLIIFSLLAADYFSIGIKISIPGLTLDEVKGSREFLIFFSGILSTLSLIAQNNQYTLDSTIRFIVRDKYPETLKQIYTAKYFWNDNFPRYFPVQTPHLAFTSVQSRILDFITYGWMLLIAIYVFFFSLLSIIISLDVWNTAGLGWLSRFIASGAIANSVLCFGYLLITRSRMPYRNYMKLQELEVLKQVAPSQVAEKNSAMYDEGTDDYISLVDRGYLTGDPMRDNPKPKGETSPRRFVFWLCFGIAFLIGF